MSTAGPVKAALLALWQATFDPSVVQVTYGGRIAVAGAQRLSIGNAIGRSAPEALGPQRTMQEEYDVVCVVSVTQPGTVDDQQLVTDQALALFTGAEYAVRSVPGQNLGVSGVMYAGVEGDWQMTEAPASETGGPINASYEFRVHVRAIYRLS